MKNVTPRFPPPGTRRLLDELDDIPQVLPEVAEPQFPPGHRRPARPTLLTRETEKRYFYARRSGSSQADSARYAGISPVTVEKWIRRAKGLEPNRPPRPEYIRFWRMDEEAKAEVKILVVGNLVARSRLDHNAALAYLKVHGGPEWRGEGEPDAPSVPQLGSGQQASGPTLIDQRDSTFIVLPREAIPDLVHQLLDGRRREMVAANPINVTPAPELPRRNGDSRAARQGLRVDSDEDLDG